MADATVLKTVGGNPVRVRLPSPAPQDSSHPSSVPAKNCIFLFYSFAFFAAWREVLIKKEAIIVNHRTMDICRPPYISPEPLFRRIQLESIVPRAWMIAQIDDFLYDNDRGYFFLEADAGLGKTSFLAHLVQERGYIHLFVEQARGLNNVAKGLRSLATQIVRRWNLYPYFAEDVLPIVAVRPGFLQRLLYMAAQQRDHVDPNVPIVLVIDSLDEAGTFLGQNILGLPQLLPKGVYIITAQRPNTVILAVDVPTHLVRFGATNPQNCDDIHLYLEHALPHTAIADTLQDERLAAHIIVTLVQKSHGVWSYIVHVLDRLKHHVHDTHALYALLEELPDGIHAYRAAYWREQRSADSLAWNRTLLPLLATLCAAMESLPLDLLCVLAESGRGPSVSHFPLHVVQHVLEEEWRSFVTVEEGDTRRYCLSDNTMRAFLEGHGMDENLDADDKNMRQELVQAVQQAHNRIAERYLSAWGKLEHGLPKLADRQARHLDDGYGLRHLVPHLAGAGRIADVHTLLRQEQHVPDYAPVTFPDLFRWVERMVHGWRRAHAGYHTHTLIWYTAREQEGNLADYLSDIFVAWQRCAGCHALLGVRGTDGRCEDVHSDEAIGLQCQYIFISTSINSQSNKVPPSLLSALLEKGIWTPGYALAQVQQLWSGTRQAVALSVLAPYLRTDAAQGEGLLRDALALAQALPDEEHRAKALAGLAPHLPIELLYEALATARDIGQPAWRTMALVGLAPSVPADKQNNLLVEALQTARSVWQPSVRVEALGTLAPYLSEALLLDALEIARFIPNDDWRAQAVVGLAPYLPKTLLREALTMWESWSGYWRARVLVELANRLGELGDVYKALDIAQTIRNEHERAAAMAGLAPYLPDSMLLETFEMAQAIGHEKQRALALTGLVPYLPKRQRDMVHTIAQKMRDDHSRLDVLLALMPHVHEREHAALINEVSGLALNLKDRRERAKTLTKLALHLAELGHVKIALETVEMMKHKEDQTVAMASLAAHLPDSLLHTVLDKVPTIEDAEQRYQVIAKLAPYLSHPLLLRALKVTRAIGDNTYRIWTVVKMASYLSEQVLHMVLDEVKKMDHEQDRANALVALMPYLSEPLAQEAIQAVCATVEGGYQEIALAELPHHLRDLLLPALFQAAQKIPNEQHRAIALLDLLPYLPESLMPEFVQTAQGIKRVDEYAQVFIGLIPYLPDSLLQDVVAELSRLQETHHLSQVLTVAAACLASHEHYVQALDSAKRIPHADERARTLVRLAPSLPETSLEEVLESAQAIADRGERAKALADLLPHLPLEVRSDVFAAVLEDARAARWKEVAAPSEIVPQLPPGASLLKEVFDSVRMVSSLDDRVAALVELALFLDAPLKDDALHEALATVRLMWGKYRAEALVKLAPHLPEPLLLDALREVQALEQDDWRLMSLAGMVSYLPQSHRHFALEELCKAVRAARDPKECVYMLAQLIPHVSEPERLELLSDALEKTLHVENADERGRSLALLVPHVLCLPVDEVYPLWCNVTRSLSMRTRYDALSDIFVLRRVIELLGGRQAVSATAEAMIHVGRWFL